MIPSTPASLACSALTVPEERDSQDLSTNCNEKSWTGSKKAGAVKRADAQALIQQSTLSEALKQEILDSSLVLERIQNFYPEAECILQSALAGPDQYRCLSPVKDPPL